MSYPSPFSFLYVVFPLVVVWSFVIMQCWVHFMAVSGVGILRGHFVDEESYFLDRF